MRDTVESIRNVLADFAFRADSATEPDQIAALFTPDGKWVLGGTELRGRATIADAIARQRESGAAGPNSGKVHVTGAALIIPTDEPHTAEARSYWMLIDTKRATVIAAGEYRDVLVSTPTDGWLIHRRTVA
ncbi:nuclear transport factor 2 family protein [Microbacterium sp. AGC85]